MPDSTDRRSHRSIPLAELSEIMFVELWRLLQAEHVAMELRFDREQVDHKPVNLELRCSMSMDATSTTNRSVVGCVETAIALDREPASTGCRDLLQVHLRSSRLESRAGHPASSRRGKRGGKGGGGGGGGGVVRSYRTASPFKRLYFFLWL